MDLVKAFKGSREIEDELRALATRKELLKLFEFTDNRQCEPAVRPAKVSSCWTSEVGLFPQVVKTKGKISFRH